MRLDLTLTFPDGGTRLRRFTYQVASAPTLAFCSPAATYLNGLAATAQAEGDLIGYAITLNAGGISTSTHRWPTCLRTSTASCTTST